MRIISLFIIGMFILLFAIASLSSNKSRDIIIDLISFLLLVIPFFYIYNN